LSELQSLDELASVIVIDTGTGLSPWTQRFWTRAHLAILVTSPDDESVMNTYAALKRCAADSVEADIRVLANQCENDAIASVVYDRLSVASKRFLSTEIATLRSLPMHRADPRWRACDLPRVWESPNTPFGRAALWLGQAVSELVPTEGAAITHANGARPTGKLSLFQFQQNRSSRRASSADNSRHHTGVPVGVKLAELRQA
jgi:MinD-like ATPase involved in chromosome partitioning or flagellar assembly